MDPSCFNFLLIGYYLLVNHFPLLLFRFSPGLWPWEVWDLFLNAWWWWWIDDDEYKFIDNNLLIVYVGLYAVECIEWGWRNCTSMRYISICLPSFLCWLFAMRVFPQRAPSYNAGSLVTCFRQWRAGYGHQVNWTLRESGSCDAWLM